MKKSPAEAPTRHWITQPLPNLMNDYAQAEALRFLALLNQDASKARLRFFSNKPKPRKAHASTEEG